ncbi:selenide, water dikinase [Acetomicrobium hydrogeniformans ATCC BAA-1850]|uniref:Selenide, water dikinase n=1 Tax=Acetomicrobium hydrogeniformans ATCC BAA-1850 TaxID=592015 RepID=A0A0T5XCB7_9BACT|nr:selenide, water dikinase [Acetomicrobium hydrogeniformans ATCC BAA-1850]
MLDNFTVQEHPRLLSSWKGGEDATLWILSDERAAVLTVDIITPVVDDPYTWGQIAAANSLSDVFAMGGRPLLALNVVGFPINCLPLDTLSAILEGGMERATKAGAIMAGGHTVEDDEPKYGLVVYGEVALNEIWRTTGARPKDKIILTKPLGTGVFSTALKADLLSKEEEEVMISQMMSLNDLPLYLPQEVRRKVHACTDVTGFGLIGHLLNMLDENIDIRIEAKRVPLLAGVTEKISMGLVPAGAYRNKDCYKSTGKVTGLESLDENLEDALFDPQTSGGLLLAVDPDVEDVILDVARKKGFVGSNVIGEVTEGKGKVKIN